MTRINEDGNLIGRIGALAVLAAACALLGRICGVGAFCPIPDSGRSALADKPSK